MRMFRIIFLALFLGTLSYGVNLIEYKINPNGENDINFTFSFDGKFSKNNVVQRRSNEALTLVFENVNYEKKNESVSVNSPLVSEFLIKSDEKSTTIAMKTAKNVRINLDEINDGVGLMLRVLSENAPFSNTPISLAQNSTQKSTSIAKYDFTSYIIVMSLLFVLLIALWWLSRSLKRSKFGGKEFKILFQRPLDKANKFAILEYNAKRYTMILGNSNILLNIEDLAPSENKSLANAVKSGVNSSDVLDFNEALKSSLNSNSANLNTNSSINSTLNLGENLAENDKFNNANLSKNSSKSSNENPKNSKQNSSKKEKSFDNFFEENKKRLQNLINGK